MLLLLLFGLSAIVPVVQGACYLADQSTTIIPGSPGPLQLTIARTIACSAALFNGSIEYMLSATVHTSNTVNFVVVSPATYSMSAVPQTSTISFAEFTPLGQLSAGQTINVAWTATGSDPLPTPASGTYTFWYIQSGPPDASDMTSPTVPTVPTTTASLSPFSSSDFTTSTTTGQKFTGATISTSSSNSTTSTATPEPSPGPPAGAIAGGVVGGVAALAIIGVGFWYYRRPRRTAAAALGTAPAMSYPRDMAGEQGTAKTSGLETGLSEKKPKKDLRFDW